MEMEVNDRVNKAIRTMISDLILRNTELAVRVELLTEEVNKYKPKPEPKAEDKTDKLKLVDGKND